MNLNFYLSFTYDVGSTSQGIDPEQWDRFVALVYKLLEDHPTSQADTVMALQLGGSFYQHYDNWKNEGINFVKPSRKRLHIY